MPLTDDELFDFDRSRLAEGNEKRAAQALERVPELYRNHLQVTVTTLAEPARCVKGCGRVTDKAYNSVPLCNKHAKPPRRKRAVRTVSGGLPTLGKHRR